MSEDVVEGVVARITFENPESGFRVVKVRPIKSQQTRLGDDDADLVTVVGRFPSVAKGETIRAVGTFEKDAQYGAQLRADIVTTQTPTTPAGIARYLGGGAIPGVGRRTAEKVVAHFGADTIRVLDQEPHRLREVLGASRAKVLAASWKEQRALRELMVFLASLSIPPSLAQRIHKRYGDRALEVVRGSPYRLAVEVWGVGFKSADAIAREVGIAPDDPQRAQAGVLHVVQTFAEEGHTVIERGVLALRSAMLLDGIVEARDAPPPNQATVTRAFDAMDVLVAAKILVVEAEGVAHAPLVEKEAGIARSIARLLGEDASPIGGVERAIASFEAATGVKLAEAQRRAVELVARSKVAVVTGGPGVGKTTIVRAILALFEGAKKKALLAAPTGRAAKRMSEATGREASTIHRLLEYDPKRQAFARDAANPIDANALVVDEASMIDVPLCDALLAATPTNTRVVFVGDVDQLPSIGPGAVLRDAIASGVVPTVRLTEVFRQAGASRIVGAAHAILRGEDVAPSPPSAAARAPNGELFVIERATPEECAKTIVEVVESRIPRTFGLDARRDVQVLVPMVRGLVGTRALNVDLQARLNANAPGVKRGETTFRVGDRVMQIRNDYQREVFNGDLGAVKSVAAQDADEETKLVVRMEDGRDVPYDDSDLDELTLAYACTVHKSQGSEYPAVVIGLVNQHFVMLARKLLYTAVTRGKKLVVIVGSNWAIREAIRDARGEDRRTTLARRLRGGSVGSN